MTRGWKWSAESRPVSRLDCLDQAQDSIASNTFDGNLEESTTPRDLVSNSNRIDEFKSNMCQLRRHQGFSLPVKTCQEMSRDPVRWLPLGCILGGSLNISGHDFIELKLSLKNKCRCCTSQGTYLPSCCPKCRVSTPGVGRYYGRGLDLTLAVCVLDVDLLEQVFKSHTVVFWASRVWDEKPYLGLCRGYPRDLDSPNFSFDWFPSQVI